MEQETFLNIRMEEENNCQKQVSASTFNPLREFHHAITALPPLNMQ